MVLIETKGSVKFFKDDNGKQHQQIGGGKLWKVYDGKMRYKYIQKVGSHTIEYNLNGVHGFCIRDNRGYMLECNFWDLDEAVAAANLMN